MDPIQITGLINRAESDVETQDITYASLLGRYQLVDTKTLSKLLALSEIQVKQMALEGEIPSLKIGRSRRFNIVDVYDSIFANQ